MKKILTCFLALIMCANALCLSAFASNADSTPDLEFLNRLGIVHGDENGMRANDSITRMEFVALLIRFLGYEEIAQNYESSVSYDDVSLDSWGKKYIDFATDLSYVQGYGENKFAPDNDITCNEMIKTVVSALGYGDIAERDGYPNGYLNMARRLDILSNVIIGDEPSSRANVAALLVNALNVHMRNLVSKSDSDMYVIESKPMIEMLGFESFEGTVVGTYGADFGKGTELKRGEVMIGERIFISLCGSMADQLGYRVKVYAKKNADGKYEIYYAERTDFDDETIIYADDIDDTTTKNQIVYYENIKTRTINLDNSSIIIYNGKLLSTADVSDSVLKPKSGYIVVNDSQSEDIRAVFVWEYTDYVVKSVYDGVVYGKYGKSVNLDKDDLDALEIVYNDKPVEIDEIKPGMVLSVAKSLDGKYAKAYLTDNVISGTVAAMDDDCVEMSIDDDSCEYEMSSEFKYEFNKTKSDIIQFRPGDEVSLYINYFGQIVDVDGTEIKSDYKYGYLFDIYVDEGLDRKITVQLLDADNNILDIESESKGKIFFGRSVNGAYTISSMSAADVADAVSGADGVNKQLIKYRLNSSGYLKGIYLVGSNSSVWGSSTGTVTYGYYSKVIDNTYVVDTDTVVFNVPNNAKNIEDCKSGKALSLISNAEYTMSLYDIEDNKVGVVVVSPSVTEGNGYKYIIDKVNSPVMLIEEVRTGLNDDETPETKLVGWQNGQKVSVFVADTLQINSDSKSVLKPGVVIQYMLNDDEISNAYTKDNAQHIILFKELFDFNKDNEPMQLWNYSSISALNAGIRIVYGTVTNYDEPNLIVEADEPAAASVHGGTSVVKWTHGSNKGEKATLDAIGVGQRVFVRMRYNNTRDVFIID